MKKLLMLLLLLGLVSAKPTIQENYSNIKVKNGYQNIQMEVINQEAPTSSALTWYAYDILGMSVVGITFTGVSTGNVPTTISAQAIYSDGSAVTTAQTITAGTDLTELKSTAYKFTLPAISVTRNVSFNFVIAD